MFIDVIGGIYMYYIPGIGNFHHCQKLQAMRRINLEKKKKTTQFHKFQVMAHVPLLA
jgi:hypothetical protein